MAIISDVVINNVSVDELTDAQGQVTYSISANWQVKVSGGSFRGPFQIKIWQDDTLIKEKEVAAGYQFKSEAIALDTAKYYQIQVLALHDKEVLAESKKEEILIEKFQNIQAAFQSERLHLTWNQPSTHVIKGLITINSGFSLKKYITRFDTFLDIPLSELTHDLTQPAKITFTAIDTNEKSYGPNTQEQYCMFAQAKLQRVKEYKKVFANDRSNGMDITVTFDVPYQTKLLQDTDTKIKMYLTDNHHAFIYSDAQPCLESGKEMTFHFTSDFDHLLEGIEHMYAGIMLCGNGWSNEEKPKETRIPLAKLQLKDTRFSDGNLMINWQYSGEQKPLSYEIAAKDHTAIYVPGEEYSYAYTRASEEDITIAPVFFSGIGPHTTAKKNCLPLALYVEQKDPLAQIKLKGSNVDEKKLTVYFKEELFKNPWENKREETSEPFTLTAQAGIYRLTVNEENEITAKQFVDFLIFLEKQGIKKDRLVWLKDSLSRLLPVNISDSAVFTYGFEGDKRRCDITAGMRLKTEWEAYRSQQLNQDEDYGFHATNVSYYDVGASYPAGQEYLLHFDAFLNQMRGISFEDADGDSSRGQAAGFRQSIGGELDLFHDKFRFPYYSIVYPQYYHPSMLPVSSFAGEHLMLLGSDSIAQMQSSLQMLEEDFVSMDKLPAAAAYFHGRTMLQPQIPIFWLQTLTYVPLGTKLKDLLESSGMPNACLHKIHLKRPVGGIFIGGATADASQKADYLSIYPQTAKDMEALREIVLLRGDVITYEAEEIRTGISGCPL